MAEDVRAKMQAKVQALLEAGKTPDEIRGMRNQLLTEIGMGPTVTPKPAPVDMAQAVSKQPEAEGSMLGMQSPGRRAFEAVGKAGRTLAAGVQGVNETLVPGGLLGRVAEFFGGPTTEQYQSESPNAVALGKGTGMGVSAVAGPTAMLNKAVTTGVSNVLPKAAIPITQKLAPQAITGATVAGMESGGDPEAIASGGLLATLLGGVPLVGSAARRSIQKASPWVGKYAQAKEAGRLPAARALPKGREGVVKASEQARDDILTRKGDIESQAGGEYAAVESATAEGAANVGAVRKALNEVRTGNQLSSGKPINQTLDDEVSSLESLMLDDMPTKDLLALRRSLQERANFQNKSPTDREQAARKLYEALRQGVRESSPKLAAADDAFTSVKKETGKTEEILGSKKPIKTRAQKRKAAAELEYLDDESMPALRRKGGLDELAEQDPAYAQALENLRAKKALESTRLLTLTPGPRASLDPAIASLGGTPLNLLRQYGRGGARLLDQSLRGPEAMGNMGIMPFTLLDAIMRRKQEKR